jgi:membrane protease YdiL (CAAX protease family)
VLAAAAITERCKRTRPAGTSPNKRIQVRSPLAGPHLILYVRSHRREYMTLSRREAVLIAASLPVSVAVLNEYWLYYLHAHHPIFFWAADIAQFVVLPACCFAFLSRHAVRPADFGFKPLSPVLGPLDGVATIAVASSIFWLSYWPIRQLAWRLLWKFGGDFGFNLAVPTDGVWHWLAAAYFALTAGFVEETVFRALPWLYLSLLLPNRRKTALYALLTSVLFAAAHSEQGLPGEVPTFILGLAAALLYARLQNIWPLVIAHTALDFIDFGWK